jgi:hypothetical protein
MPALTAPALPLAAPRPGPGQRPAHGHRGHSADPAARDRPRHPPRVAAFQAGTFPTSTTVPAMSVPSRTAITGFTYAHVATVAVGSALTATPYAEKRCGPVTSRRRSLVNSPPGRRAAGRRRENCRAHHHRVPARHREPRGSQQTRPGRPPPHRDPTRTKQRHRRQQIQERDPGAPGRGLSRATRKSPRPTVIAMTIVPEPVSPLRSCRGARGARRPGQLAGGGASPAAHTGRWPRAWPAAAGSHARTGGVLSRPALSRCGGSPRSGDDLLPASLESAKQDCPDAVSVSGAPSQPVAAMQEECASRTW